MELEARNFQTTIDGKPVDLYTLRNASGAVVKITNYGSRIVQVLVPDRTGALDDVVLGYDSIEGVRAGQASMGAFIGRFANRIAHGTFMLNGRTYTLAKNNGPNFMHGGEKGSRFCVFDAEQLDAVTLRATYTYADGEEGLPGTVASAVVYRLGEDNALTITFEAVSDQPTIVNFTDHTYFNLAGAGNGTILDHFLKINADRFTPVDATGIPTGELRAVRGTPMDFTQATPIGAHIDADDDQVRKCNGYDMNYVLNKASGMVTHAAHVSEPRSGRALDVFTTQPGLQFFSANQLTGEGPRDVGKGGKPYVRRSAFCLEAQGFPDAPNHPAFPSTVLNPGERYSGAIIYKFSVE